MFIKEYLHNKDVLTKSAFLFLHGFPAESINIDKNEKTQKNQDIAFEFYNTFSIDTFVPHYTGLGNSRGDFSFTQSILDSIEISKDLLRRGYENIYLVGHSWGALVSLNIYRELKKNIKAMVLISPFNYLPPEDELREILNYVTDEVPYIFNNKGIDDYLDELKIVKENFNPRKIAQLINFDSPTYIFQAREDLEVPAETTQELKALLGDNCFYQIIDTDHSLNRRRGEIINEIIREINDKKII